MLLVVSISFLLGITYFFFIVYEYQYGFNIVNLNQKYQMLYCKRASAIFIDLQFTVDRINGIKNFVFKTRVYVTKTPGLT